MKRSENLAKVNEIVVRSLARITGDLSDIPGILGIDFIDIFPTSEEHRVALDAELSKNAKVLKIAERGNVYELVSLINTEFGKLKYIKIRFFDETRLNWEAAADFKVENRQVLLDKVGKDKRFSYIERPDWTAVEFKTDNTLIYFLEPLASVVYGKENDTVAKVETLIRQKSDEYQENDPGKYDFWNSHLKYVYREAMSLAKKYKADLEIVQLGALLHDVALLEKVGTKAEHHENGKKLAEQILNQYGYPVDKTQRVLGCVFHHRSSKNAENIEELCVADADILAHFDNIPMLFDAAYGLRKMVGLRNVRNFIRETFDKDFEDLSEKTKPEFAPRYRLIREVVLGNED